MELLLTFVLSVSWRIASIMPIPCTQRPNFMAQVAPYTMGLALL